MIAMIHRLRYIAGRAAIHAGLRMLPPGRGRRELIEIITAWSIKVQALVAADRAIKTQEGAVSLNIGLELDGYEPGSEEYRREREVRLKRLRRKRGDEGK